MEEGRTPQSDPNGTAVEEVRACREKCTEAKDSGRQGHGHRVAVMALRCL